MVFSNNMFLGVSAQASEYLISQSLLFNDNDSAYLSRTPSVAGNRKTWTYSVWVKYSVDNTSGNAIFGSGATAAEDTFAYINGTTTHTLEWIVRDSSTLRGLTRTDAVFRDPGAWYHLVFVLDTTNVTAGDRMRLWVNGVEVTSFSSKTNPPLNTDSALNSTLTQYIGKSRADGGTNLWNGLIALPILVDGAALDATSFGELDADGYWNPIEFTGANTIDFVPGATGTIIGNMTETSSGESLAASFDGDKSNTDTQGSKTTVGLSTANATVGKQFSSAKTITDAYTTGSTNRGYATGSYTGSLTIYLKSSNSGIGVSETVHDSVTFNNSNATNPKTLTGDGSSATYWWVEIEGATGELGLMAEVEFYEASAAAGFGTNGGEYDFADTSNFGFDVSESSNLAVSGVDFNGSTGYASFTAAGGVSSGSGPFTMLAWVRPDTFVNYAGIIAIGDVYLALDSTNTGQVAALGAINVQVITNADVLAVDEWTQIVVTHPGGLMNTTNTLLYANGSLQATSLAGDAYTPTLTTTGYIADNPAAAGVVWNGEIGYVSIWDEVLSAAEIAALYNSGTPLDPTTNSGDYTSSAGLVHNFPMQDDVPSTTLDDTQQVADATLVGGYEWRVSNSYAANNFTADDQLSDTPTDSAADEIGNFATWNPLNKQSNLTLSEGNLVTTSPVVGTWRSVVSTVAMTSGKYYWEATADANGAANHYFVGIARTTYSALTDNVYIGNVAGTWGYYGANGQKYLESVNSAYGASYTTNDIIGVAYDADIGELTFYKNGVSQGVAVTGLSGAMVAGTTGYNGSGMTHNFGQTAFTYTPPTGFSALATQNLPAPTIADPSAYFNTVLYTGTGADQSVTSLDFQSDLIWVKQRNAPDQNVIVDSVRGFSKELYPNLTNAESGDTGAITATSNGFDLGSSGDLGRFNELSSTYVAWCWKAGGTAVTNSTFSITSQVSVNTTSKFSIVTYTAPASPSTVETVGHSLGAVPDMIIWKNRTDSVNWYVWHKDLAANNNLKLNSTAAQTNDGVIVGDPPASPSHFNTLGALHTANKDYVAYCWAEVEGFSKFGSYTGNGSADGPFVYCGFRPAFVLIKDINSGVDGWVIEDAVRDTYNPVSKLLLANSSGAELTPYNIDFLSNGFKIRTTTAGFNTNTNTMIYAAFAEHPFQGDDGYTQARAR